METSDPDADPIGSCALNTRSGTMSIPTPFRFSASHPKSRLYEIDKRLLRGIQPESVLILGFWCGLDAYVCVSVSILICCVPFCYLFPPFFSCRPLPDFVIHPNVLHCGSMYRAHFPVSSPFPYFPSCHRIEYYTRSARAETAFSIGCRPLYTFTGSAHISHISPFTYPICVCSALRFSLNCYLPMIMCPVA